MIPHGKKCSHCRGDMSLPKPINDGPRSGQTRTICMKCGHIEYQSRQPQQRGNGNTAFRPKEKEETIEETTTTPVEIQIYLYQEGQQAGPFSDQQIIEMLNAGSITQADLAWYEGLDEWQPLDAIFTFATGDTGEA